jgi:mannitol/fructose-specific phosphotransferase system IIA component (Ntr-type)
MQGICERLDRTCILLDVHAAEKEVIIRAMVEALHQKGSVPHVPEQVKDILSREQLGSTCIGAGCAVPHAHSVGLTETSLAAARLAEPLTAETPDGQPVDLVFLLIGPPHHAATHLKILSKLARLLHDDTLRTDLRNAINAEEFIQAICRRES